MNDKILLAIGLLLVRTCTATQTELCHSLPNQPLDYSNISQRHVPACLVRQLCRAHDSTINTIPDKLVPSDLLAFLVVRPFNLDKSSCSPLRSGWRALWISHAP